MTKINQFSGLRFENDNTSRDSRYTLGYEVGERFAEDSYVFDKVKLEKHSDEFIMGYKDALGDREEH